MHPLATEDLEHVLKHTAPLWSEARGRRIFLSGCTGFFGAWLLESLAFCNRELSLGLSATVLSRDPEAFVRKMPHIAGEPSIQLHQGDVRTFAFPQGQFDYVIHAAASTSADAASQPLRIVEHAGGWHRANGRVRRGRMGRRGSSSPVPEPSTGGSLKNLSHIPEDYLGGPDWLDPAAAYGEGKRVC